MKKVITKILAVALAAIIATSLFVSAFAAFRGDVNHDSNVNAIDALTILSYSVGIEDEIDEKAADVNGDNTINALDALGVLRISVGLDAKEEIEEDTQASVPSSVEEIVEFYNNAVNKVVSDKAGYSKQRTTTVTHLDAGSYTNAAGDIVKEFLGEGTSEFKNSKGSAKHLSTSSLTTADVKSATCENNAGVYTITLELKDGSSSYTKKAASDNSPLKNCGLVTGSKLNPEFDYLNSTCISAGVADKGAKVSSINQTTTNAKIVIAVNASTGEMISYTASFDWAVEIKDISVLFIKVPTATGKAHTAVVISDFKW